MADPARTPPATFAEKRDKGAAACRKIPCLPVRLILKGSLSAYPGCTECIHEDKIRRKRCEE